ncbi:Histidine kinase-, DNA gyrase B-, and HSP90-like ATPase [Desulfuromusa kysingii]|uniref:histidine kinase n=1 Tax=Desulfuromusa kysingii TaxID=37625 RepID=A0A1H3XKP5_9BACT|nr:ATP-binding protein [Desulfuromusa kysingii]SDZ99916.1 Histidine kinase-, DNA gyrase B-, and HSP90-like ATPase [Desulfuromusa kysingii]
MRITVKQQVLLAPATILVLLILLLAFMQYTYWDLSFKRREAKAIGTTFVAVAEADMAARRLHVLLRTMQHTGMAAPEEMALVADLYERMLDSISRIKPFGPLVGSGHLASLLELAENLNPADSPETEQTAESFARFRAELSALSNITQIYRNQSRVAQEQDINQLVERTATVSMSVLVLAILLGLLISGYFSRRILNRVQNLSQNAASIADGKLEIPPAPDRIRDELDTLAVSINRMTKRLVQVVGTEKLLEGAEEERRRIAMDLHDQSLSDLSTILRGLQNLRENQSDPRAHEKTQKLEQDLERAIANLREIMNNLHPQILDILGLGAALEAHLEQHCNTEDLPEYHLYIDPESNTLDLGRLKQLALYRIAIEAIQNVIKHAGATRYEVNLEICEQTLVLSIEDNGKGMLDQNGSNPGRGLNNIRERARAISATVEWKPSRFSSGTRFELTLPC